MKRREFLKNAGMTAMGVAGLTAVGSAAPLMDVIVPNTKTTDTYGLFWARYREPIGEGCLFKNYHEWSQRPFHRLYVVYLNKTLLTDHMFGDGMQKDWDSGFMWKYIDCWFNSHFGGVPLFHVDAVTNYTRHACPLIEVTLRDNPYNDKIEKFPHSADFADDVQRKTGTDAVPGICVARVHSFDRESALEPHKMAEWVSTDTIWRSENGIIV